MDDIEHDCNRYINDDKICLVCHTRFDMKEIEAHEAYFTNILEREFLNE